MLKADFKTSVPSLLLLLCLQLVAARVHAQEAHRIDEIENPRCDLSEVPPLDPPPGGRFATALRDIPDARGAVVIYGLQGKATRYAQDVKERLIKFAGVAPERLITLYGGHTKDRRMELWIIPKGTAKPKSDFIEDTKKARPFDTYHYWSGEYCGPDRPPALAEFAKALKQRAGWQGYIIVRPHRNRRGVRMASEGWDPDGYISRKQARQRAFKDKQHLVKKFGLAPARIKALVGDNDEWTHAEVWLVPPGAESPLAKAKSSIK